METAKTNQKEVEILRQAIEHRAMWFALLIDAAKEKGLDPNFARAAIHKCGIFQGRNKFPRTDDLGEFEKTFVTPQLREVFQMEPKREGNTLRVSFHDCPLVAAWKKLGIPEEQLPLLCDIAMEGDRGVASTYENMQFTLGKTIAQGNPTCEVEFVLTPKE